MITGQALPARGETSAARRECESMTVEPQINFTTSYGKLVYDFSLSKNELSRIARQAEFLKKGFLPPDWLWSILTRNMN